MLKVLVINLFYQYLVLKIGYNQVKKSIFMYKKVYSGYKGTWNLGKIGGDLFQSLINYQLSY